MINDADIQMNQMTIESNHMSKATKKHGVCFHGSLHGLTCDLCGKVFQSDEHLMEVISNLRAEWC